MQLLAAPASTSCPRAERQLPAHQLSEQSLPLPLRTHTIPQSWQHRRRVLLVQRDIEMHETTSPSHQHGKLAEPEPQPLPSCAACSAAAQARDSSTEGEPALSACSPSSLCLSIPNPVLFQDFF